MTDPENSVEAYLQFLVENKVDDKSLYTYLASVDLLNLARWLGRLDWVDSLSPPRGRAAGSWKSRRSELKGRIYEKIVAALVEGVHCFDSWTRLQTTTNEIDILIVLAPSSSWVPSLREWGSHCICECKYQQTHVKNAWVDKLNTVVQTHGASVGLLFSRKGVALRGSPARVRHKLQILAASSSRMILCFDREDLESCIDGVNFLKLLSERYVAVQAGVRKLSMVEAD